MRLRSRQTAGTAWIWQTSSELSICFRLEVDPQPVRRRSLVRPRRPVPSSTDDGGSHNVMGMPRWPWWHEAAGPDDYRIRELLRAVWDLHALYGQSTWLWRGQPNFEHDLTPAIHTRIHAGGLTDDRVMACTLDLLDAARAAQLDIHEGTRLPDLALLAMLQHHGAATPLLDVSLDPLVGLYMGAVSPHAIDDDKDGVLFAIKRPASTFPAFTSNGFVEVYEGLPVDSPVMYSAPDVSERLRIQRGHFLFSKVDSRFRTSIPLSIEHPAH